MPGTPKKSSSPKKMCSPNHKLSLSRLPKHQRELLSCRGQSLVLTDGSRHVLLITHDKFATNIRRIAKVSESPIQAEAMHLLFPEEVDITTSNELLEIIDELDPENARKTLFSSEFYRQLTPKQKQSFHQKPCVFRFKRCNGSLEDLLSETRLTDKFIEMFEEQIQTAIDVLDAQQMSHNDVAMRNVLLSGIFPHIKFFLADYGSVSVNVEEGPHIKKYQRDCSRLQAMISKLKQELRERKERKAKQETLIATGVAMTFSCKRLRTHHDENPHDSDTESVNTLLDKLENWSSKKRLKP